MRITIVGAGALGGVFGALLHRAGERVSFVARGEALRLLRERGLRGESPLGPLETGPLEASERAADLGVADVVLVAIKAWQVEGLAPQLAPLVGPATLVVPTQNGVEAPDRLAATLGAGVVGGIANVIALLTGPAEVKHRGMRPRLTVGERGGGPSARLDALVAPFARAGIDVVVTPDVRAALWEKLLFVEPMGSVGARHRATADVIRAQPALLAELEATMREVEQVARACGVTLAPDAVSRALARYGELPAGHAASMHRDLLEGRPSELSDQTGAVVRLARAHGVPAPLHEALLAALEPLDRASRRA